MEKGFTEKYMALKEMVENFVSRGIAVAFSGGVDSALILKLACMAAEEKSPAGEKSSAEEKYPVYAVTVQTKLHPAGDLEEAKQAAAEMGAVHKVLYINELAETGIETNPVNRCYLCKKGIFRKIKALAEELSVNYVLEGTNADDLGQYRPGIQALKELQIISPLAACGLTKAEIRELAEYLGISAANRPSSPCLATRLPYGTKISYGLLAKIDEGERFLRELGFYNVRLRVHELTEMVDEKWDREISGDIGNVKKMSAYPENEDGTKAGNREKVWLARIEVDWEDMSKLLEYRAKVVKKMKELGFSRVTLDMEGFRSGSMDETLLAKSV